VGLLQGFTITAAHGPTPREILTQEVRGGPGNLHSFQGTQADLEARFSDTWGKLLRSFPIVLRQVWLALEKGKGDFSY
jgi:hypothetical protein